MVKHILLKNHENTPWKPHLMEVFAIYLEIPQNIGPLLALSFVEKVARADYVEAASCRHRHATFQEGGCGDLKWATLVV